MTINKARFARIMAATLGLVFVFAAGAAAHKVNIFAYAEDGKVHTESYYADGGRCVDSKVTVEDKSGKLLLEGKTDKEGMFVFDIPKAEDLKIVIHAGMGHQNYYVVKADELKDALKPPVAGTKTKADDKAGTAAGPKAETQENAEEPAGMSKPGATEGPEEAVHENDTSIAAYDETQLTLSPEDERMQRVVDRVVEARLKPVYRMLAEMKEQSEKHTMKDTISGLGYIFGILAIIHFLRSRKK